MRCACGLVVPRCRGVGDGFGGGPAVLSVFGENRWPWVSGSFVLAGQRVGFFTCSEYGTCETVISCRLWIWVRYPFLGYLAIQQP